MLLSALFLLSSIQNTFWMLRCKDPDYGKRPASFLIKAWLKCSTLEMDFGRCCVLAGFPFPHILPLSLTGTKFWVMTSLVLSCRNISTGWWANEIHVQPSLHDCMATFYLNSEERRKGETESKDGFVLCLKCGILKNHISVCHNVTVNVHNAAVSTQRWIYF